MLLDKKKLSLLSLSLLSFSLIAHAEPNNSHVIVAPQCLIKENAAHFNTLSTTKNFVLIETNDAGIEKLISAKEATRTKPCGGFMDVTEAWLSHHSKTLSFADKAKEFLIQQTEINALPAKLAKAKYEIQYEKQVNEKIALLNPQNMWDNLTILTNFNDRHANSDNGVAASKKIIDILNHYNQRDDVTIYTVATGTRYKQPSVIAKIGRGDEPGIVIGAHIDTVISPSSKRPGADDDGSGSVTILEVARTLLSTNTQYKKPIYFMWYAAEEQGLVGSSYVVADFKKKNIPIEAVIHFDLTGYAHKNEPTLWLINDYTDKSLTAYIEKLITTYVKQPVKYTSCGYACSDHASWTKGGVAAAMPAEAAFEKSNPNIHSAQDTMDKLSLVHMSDYAKLGTAFAVEMAQPISN